MKALDTYCHTIHIISRNVEYFCTSPKAYEYIHQKLRNISQNTEEAQMLFSFNNLEMFLLQSLKECTTLQIYHYDKDI